MHDNGVARYRIGSQSGFPDNPRRKVPAYVIFILIGWVVRLRRLVSYDSVMLGYQCLSSVWGMVVVLYRPCSPPINAQKRRKATPDYLGVSSAGHPRHVAVLHPRVCRVEIALESCCVTVWHFREDEKFESKPNETFTGCGCCYTELGGGYRILGPVRIT